MDLTMSAPTTRTTGSAPAVQALISALGPVIGEAVDWFAPTQPDDMQVVPGSELLQPERLGEIVTQLQQTRGWGHRRAAASWWFVVYCEVVLLGTMPAMTLAGIALDLSLDNVSLVLEDGAPAGLLLHDVAGTVAFPPRAGALTGAPPISVVADLPALHEALVERVYRRNIVPVLNAVHDLTRLSNQILWGSVGSITGYALEEHAEPGQAADAARADYAAIMDDPNLPILPAGNPLVNTLRRVPLGPPDLPPTVAVRRTCCLNYHLGTTCNACPLHTTEQLIERVRAMNAGAAPGES